MTTSSSPSLSSAVNLQRIWYPCRSTYHHAQQFSFNAVTLRPPFPNLPSRRQYPRLASLSNYNTTSFQPQPTFTSSVGSPPPISHQWTLTQRHLILLNFIAAATAISATWLFFSAIPTLLAFKKAAESLEKLFDVTREELPDTMAAVRLSGMEISDLTMELSDLGQEITQGVKSSTRAVRLAEERLRRLTNMNPSASMQVAVQMKSTLAGPVVARTARGIRESIVKARSFLQMFFSITQFSKVAIKYLKSRGNSKAWKKDKLGDEGNTGF